MNFCLSVYSRYIRKVLHIASIKYFLRLVCKDIKLCEELQAFLVKYSVGQSQRLE